jgi:3-oxoacyl-[acyl-carrier protein] reductase
MNSNPVMLITGTSRGIGRFLAEYYLEQGFTVIGCSRSESTIKHNEYLHYLVDLRDSSDIKRMFGNIKAALNRIDILINNAGISSSNFVMLMSDDHIEDVTKSNFISNIEIIRDSIKIMKKNKFGRIINISSVHVPLASEGTSLYSSLKSAIEQFSRVISKEIASYGITINNIGLSFFKDSGMYENLSDTMRMKLNSIFTVKPELDINDLSHLINFLIDRKTDFITGQTIYTSGVV